ncbi:hypothetical protein OROGR_022397 [Orobanche gracilis]
MMAETEVCKVYALDWADDFPPLGKGNTLEDGAGFQVPSVLESNKETKSWTEVVISAPEPFDLKVKTKSNVTVSSIIEVSNSFDVKNGVAKIIGLETKDVKDVADQTDGTGNSKEILYLQENEGTGNCHGKDIAMGSLEGYSADVVDDEEANVDAVLLNYAHEGFDRVLSPLANTNLVSEIPVLDVKQETAVKIVTSEDKLPKKVMEHENEEVMDKKPGLVIVAQEMLRKEEEAKMREQHRSEELAKADVVPEKKKRQAENVKRRPELKAQKEAEEKERLRRLKKNEKKKEKRKEKRKAAAMDANNANSRAHEGVDRIISTPANINLVSEMRILELKQEATVPAVTSDDKLPKKTTEHKNEKVMNETPGLVMVPGIDVTDEVQEQADLTRKAKEMLRREKDEAKMREQPILEELAKAEVAREKKQQAEKANMRAELIVQKEAEEREKVRLKRLRKKERMREKKKAAVMDANDTNSRATVLNTKSTVEVSKNALNNEFSLRKPQASTRTASTPPLRNRNKINYRQWMWTGLISFVVYILFWLGNLDVFSKLNVVS